MTTELEKSNSFLLCLSFLCVSFAPHMKQFTYDFFSDTGRQMCGVPPPYPHIKQICDTSWVNYNLTQFWYYKDTVPQDLSHFTWDVNYK